MSTGGTERKRQKERELPQGQQTLDRYMVAYSDNDDTESEEDDDNQMEGDDHMDSTESTSQSMTSPSAQNTLSLLGSKKDREGAMEKVHTHILPSLLKPLGWKKVYDKDLKITYRALYFNTIEKKLNENNTSHIQRVGKIRERIREEADKLKMKHGVNFKINSLLSKPILYDEQALEELSMREGSTQKQSQMDKYVT